MSIAEVVAQLSRISTNVAVLAGEVYGQTIEEAVEALRLIKVSVEDEIAQKDARIHELEVLTQEQQREREEAVAILGSRIKRLEREAGDSKEELR